MTRHGPVHTGSVEEAADPDGSGHRVMRPEPGPARHAARSPIRPARLAAAAAGAAALIAAVAVGVPALLRSPATTSSGPGTLATAKRITVSRAAPVIPLSDTELLALLDRAPDLGPLGDPQRRASCLTGLGYRAGAAVLGAEPVHLADRGAVVLLLAGEEPGTLAALMVEPSCSAADTGLLAETRVARP